MREMDVNSMHPRSKMMYFAIKYYTSNTDIILAKFSSFLYYHKHNTCDH